MLRESQWKEFFGMECLSCSFIALAGPCNRAVARWPSQCGNALGVWRSLKAPVKLQHRRRLDGGIQNIDIVGRNWQGGRQKILEAMTCTSASLTGAASTVDVSTEVFSEEDFEAFLLAMQEQICKEAAEADGSGKEFLTDRWERGRDASAGYGITRVLEGGDLLEKAAANVSIVRGRLSETRAKAMSARGRGVEAGASYFAGALSLVFHSRSPYVPTFRSDIRYFQVEGSPGWFGGGADLTPSYLAPDDFHYFHRFYHAICERYHPTLYARCKAACDQYFYIPARKEHRGIGGLFFDDMAHVGEPEGDSGAEQGSAEKGGHSKAYAFVREVALGFMPSYLPIADKARKIPFGEREREWQLLRRGRYIEFNLLYDRGVRFGLDGGRMESIMVSAPPLIAWKYNFTPEEGSPEAGLLHVLRKPQDWL